MDNNSAPAPLDVELYLQYYDLKRDPAEKDLLPVPLFSLVTLCALKQAGLTKETTSSKHFTQPSRSTYCCKKAGSFRKLGQITFQASEIREICNPVFRIVKQSKECSKNIIFAFSKNLICLLKHYFSLFSQNMVCYSKFYVSF